MTRQAAAALVASLVIAAAPTAVAGGRDPSVAEPEQVLGDDIGQGRLSPGHQVVPV